MFAFPFLILFIALMAYTGGYKRYPLREIEITDYVNSSYPGEVRHRRRSGYSSNSVSSPMVMYCAKYYDGLEHFFTFKTIRNSPPIFPAYERGEKLMAYVSPDFKSAAPEKAITGLRKIAKGVLILYLIVTCLVEVLPVVFQYFKAVNPQSLPDIDFGLIITLIPGFAVGLGFTFLGGKMLLSSLKNKKDRENGLYREIHATVTDIVAEGFGSKASYHPVFTYNITGIPQTMKSSLGSRPPKYYIGDHVTLYQNIETHEIMESYEFGNSFFSIFFVIGILTLIGTIFLATILF